MYYGSRIIVALDPPDGVNVIDWCLNIVRETRDLVAGYKIGLPLVVRLNSMEDLSILSKAMDGDRLKIVDLKLADIGNIMVSAVKPFIHHGFNYFIAHSFIGCRDGLDVLNSFLRENNAWLITVVSMSHRGSVEAMDDVVEKLLEISVNTGAWGVVAPATRPEIIRFVRKHIGSRAKILSPGIGPQGARPGDALMAGADYEIIGRMITRSSDPRHVVKEINKIHESLLGEG